MGLNTSAEPFWRCDCYTGLLHRLLEGEAFVFNPLTGHTHILNSLSWDLLIACVDVPRSETYLYDLVTLHTNEVNEQEMAATLWGHLDQLKQLELLNQVDGGVCN